LTSPPPALPFVELRAVSKIYREGDRERVVLRGVDLAVHRGTFVAVLGRSGSGKSTLLNLIGCIDAPTSGTVSIDGTVVAALGERDRALFRRRHVGFIFQFFNLVSTLTVEENLLLPLELVGRTGHKARGRASDLLREVGLLDRARAFPDRLSGGEQQRVAVARALAHEPPLILADEPTGNLDTESAEQVLGLLRRLPRERERTVIAVTHSVEVARAADRILTLTNGSVLA
jgi:putative ABC transport system ATP-binding protein